MGQVTHLSVPAGTHACPQRRRIVIMASLFASRTVDLTMFSGTVG